MRSVAQDNWSVLAAAVAAEPFSSALVAAVLRRAPLRSVARLREPLGTRLKQQSLLGIAAAHGCVRELESTLIRIRSRL